MKNPHISAQKSIFNLRAIGQELVATYFRAIQFEQNTAVLILNEQNERYRIDSHVFFTTISITTATCCLLIANDAFAFRYCEYLKHILFLFCSS